MSGGPFARHHSMASPRDLYDAGAPAWRMPSAVGAADQVLTVQAAGAVAWKDPAAAPPTIVRVIDATTDGAAFRLLFATGPAAPATSTPVATYNTTLALWPTTPGVAVQVWDARVGAVAIPDMQLASAARLQGFSTSGDVLDVDDTAATRVWFELSQVTAPAIVASGWATASWDGANYWVQFDGAGLDVSAIAGGWTMATFGSNFHYLKYDPAPAT